MILLPQGRLGRTRYQCVTGAGIALCWLSIYFVHAHPLPFDILSVGFFLWEILLTLFMIPFCIRRLHDINLSGWWILLCHPLINFGAFLVLTMMPGTQGANRYGLPPLPANRGALKLAVICLPISAFACIFTCVSNSMFIIEIYRAIEYDMNWAAQIP
jgi:uncharacterized membrane protein YhaH (DUF805 family)